MKIDPTQGAGAYRAEASRASTGRTPPPHRGLGGEDRREFSPAARAVSVGGAGRATPAPVPGGVPAVSPPTGAPVFGVAGDRAQRLQTLRQAVEQGAYRPIRRRSPRPSCARWPAAGGRSGELRRGEGGGAMRTDGPERGTEGRPDAAALSALIDVLEDLIKVHDALIAA
ncbi:hypothetical protein, partial [Hydrogenibacillus schlegelii]|uniref:hypothetical protein n=1 Tax=Hydrogenibacillus schlegelii TaxID=1484 RepID=UPI0034A04E96